MHDALHRGASVRSGKYGSNAFNGRVDASAEDVISITEGVNVYV